MSIEQKTTYSYRRQEGESLREGKKGWKTGMSYKDSASGGQGSEQAPSRCASVVCELFELRAMDTLWAQEELLPPTLII